MKHVTKKSVLLVAVVVGLLTAGTLLLTKSTSASFNANNLIDDYEFNDTSTMNAGQIDGFLNSFPKSCISSNSNSNGNPGFTTPDPTGWSPSEPNNHGYTFGGNVTAGQAIYDAARIYDLNPEALLAMMQKEQSIVTGGPGCHYNNPSPGSACTYSGGGCVFIGMSYACPGGCNASYNGFSLQVIAGAWLLRFAQERALGVTSGYPGYDPGDSSIGYGGDHVGVAYTLSDGNTITSQTGATASLYYYNPSESGNQNFDTIFQNWFGPTTGTGYELVMSSTCTSACPQYVVYDSIKQWVSGNIKAAWGLPTQPQLLDPNVLNSYATGPDLGVLATLNTTSVKTLYFMDAGQRYRIPWPSMIPTWNFNGQVISDVSPGLFTVPTAVGDLSNVIKDPNSSTYYMMDGANGSGQTVIRPYASDTIRGAWEGNLNYVPISSTYFGLVDNAVGPTLTSTTGSFNGANFQVVNGGKYMQSNAVGALFPGIQSVSGATYNRLPTLGNMTNLIQSPSSPAVYLVDNSTAHLIPWPNALNAWAAGGEGITTVNDNYISALSSGSSMSSYLAEDGSGNYYVIDAGNKHPVPANLVTAYSNSMSTMSVSSSLMSLFPTASTVTGFVQGTGQPAVYMLDNSGQLRHLPNPIIAGLWGAYQTGITQLSNYIVSGIPTAADAQIYVSDGTTNYVLDVGKLASVAGSVATDWNLSSPQVFSDGTLSRLPSTTALTNQMYDGNTYYYIRGGTAYTTTDQNIASAWGLLGSPVHNGSLAFSTMPVHPLTWFVQSSTNSANYYVVDNGSWYSLSAAQLANLGGGTGAGSMTLNPSLAPNSVTAWANFIVQDHNGNYYVIDGGTKRPANQAVANQWDNNGGTSVPVMTNGFLDELPTTSALGLSFKTSSNPAIYVVVNSQKSHIVHSSIYLQNYAPFSIVSDQLVTALPSGSDM